MNARGFVTISMHELRRVKVIEAVAEGRLSGVGAAEQLGLSERQVSRLKRRFEASGAVGLVSGKRGKPGNRQYSVSLRARVIAIIRERYGDFGPTLARAKLSECHAVLIQIQLLAFNHHTVSPATAQHCQACLTIEAMHALMVRVNAFVLHERMQSAVTKPTIFMSQFDQTRRQRFILNVWLRFVMQHAARKPDNPAARRSEMLTFSRIVTTASRLACGLSDTVRLELAGSY